MSYKRIFWICSAAFLLAAIVSSCSSTPAISRKGPTPTPVPTLVSYEKSIFTVERGSIVMDKTLNGEIVPSVQEVLFFRTNGLVSRLVVKPGDVVKKGDLLAELQVDDLLNQLRQAQIDLEVAQANAEKELSQRRFAVEKAQIDVDILKARVEIEKLNVDSATGTAKEKAELNLLIAEQNLALAQLNLKQLKEQAEPSGGQVTERQKLAVQRLEALIAERRIVAPFDGVILRVYTSAGRQATAFTQTIEMGDPAKLVIRAQMDWKVRDQLYRDMEAYMSYSSQAKDLHPISFLPDFVPFNVTEATSSQTPTQEYYYFSVPTDLPREQLKVGTSVVVTAILGRKDNVLLVPPAAVRNYRGLNFVLVQEGERRRRVEITKIGLQTNERWEVEGDLLPGEKVLGQ
ncbi:MAG TPA: biotin/lipoyl-binding protein [Anaerolineaceae bacterium]